MLRILVIALLLVASPVSAQSVSLKATHHNMFRATVRLNNAIDVPALIDTGASSLSLCNGTARSLGLRLGDSVQLSTANGIITARKAVVQSVRIGAIEVRDVGAVVKADGAACEEGLLVGMTVLSKLHVTLSDNTLTLAARYAIHAGGIAWQWPLLGAIWVVMLLSLRGLRTRHRYLRSRPVLF
jgi:clan AA aspartic protease (TIGR02281 family)